MKKMEESGQKEFHIFEVAIQMNLVTHQWKFVLNENVILIKTPINPGPEPVGAMDLRGWRKKLQSFWVKQKKWYGSLDTATAIL